jgi:lipoate---protein ligase
VGAVPGRGLLRLPAPPSLFDVEQFRGEPDRLALVRTITGPILVLGSTQPTDVVRSDALRARGVELARRRGGGGAVYVEPTDPLWLDVWIPRDDPLWRADVVTAAEWVGAWWVEALGGAGLDGLEVHAGRALPGDYGALICFAGRGPGEVFRAGKKVVGLSQWRAREGSLFSSCAYLRWDPEPLASFLVVDEHLRDELATALGDVATGLAGLDPSMRDLGGVRDRLLASFPSFGRTAP